LFKVIVYGIPIEVIFILLYLAHEVVEIAESIQLGDTFGEYSLYVGKYTSDKIDVLTLPGKC
jgi:hypothetical protein